MRIFSKPIFKKSIFKKVYAIHKALGLFIAFHALILSATGIVLVWKDELQSVSAESLPLTEKVELNASDSLQLIETATRSHRVKNKILALYRDDHVPGIWIARVAKTGETKFRGAERIPFSSNGELLSNVGSKSPMMELVLKIHRELLLGSYGKIYIGFVGVFFLVSMISGLFVLPSFTKAKSVLTFSFIRGRLAASERHIFLGIALWGWMSIVAVSGFVLSFNSFVIKTYFNSELREFETEHIPKKYGLKKDASYLSAGEIARSLKDLAPLYEPDFIAFPDNEFSLKGSFVVLLESTALVNDIKLAVVNGFTGEVSRLSELPFLLKLLVISEPLHFGDYGGFPLKVAWTVLGVHLIYFSIAGIKIFFFRSKRIRAKNTKMRGGKDPRIKRQTALIALICVLPVSFLIIGYFASGMVGVSFRWLFIFFSFALIFRLLNQISNVRDSFK